MGLRPARIYREWKRPYTRQAPKSPRKSYVRGVPGSKLHTYIMGNKNRKFETSFDLTATKKVQIRHNAIEAGRIAANAYLKKKLEDENYFLKVRISPHNVLREHAQAAVAQADRFYQGMAHPFGRPTGTAARVRIGQRIMTAYVEKKDADVAKKALRRAGLKMPCSCKISAE